MINLSASKPGEIVEKPILSGATIASEGIPLISTLSSGIECVSPCAAAAGEVFAGFSWKHNILPTTLTRVETHTIPAAPGPYTVQLERTGLVATQISVMYGATQFTEAGVGADQYQCVDATGVVTFHSTDAGLEVVITYKYTPSVTEAQMMYPGTDININPAFAFLGSLGVVRSGEIFTDQYDTAIDWSSATFFDAVYLGAGILTDTDATNSQVNGHITHIPSADNPFLGIMFWCS